MSQGCRTRIILNSTVKSPEQSVKLEETNPPEEYQMLSNEKPSVIQTKRRQCTIVNYKVMIQPVTEGPEVTNGPTLMMSTVRL
jgi:hypothetical protein